MALVSIIVPIYNVEKYLERCIVSIVNQTFRDIEILLVDDGSKDESYRIAKKWQNNDNRIVLYHKNNGGLSSARNYGLVRATSPYVMFVDSDDWISNDMVETLYRLIYRNDADIASVKMIISRDENVKVRNEKENIQIYSQKEMYEYFFRVNDLGINYCVCDKIYKRELLTDVRFTEGIHFEDIDFNYRAFKKCKRGVISNQKKYFWFYNRLGITHNLLQKKDLELKFVWQNIYEDCKKNNRYVYYSKMNLIRSYMGIIGKSIKFGVCRNFEVEWKAVRQELIRELRKNYFNLILWKMPISRKVLLSLLVISPKIVEIPFILRRKI